MTIQEQRKIQNQMLRKMIAECSEFPPDSDTAIELREIIRTFCYVCERAEEINNGLHRSEDHEALVQYLNDEGTRLGTKAVDLQQRWDRAVGLIDGWRPMKTAPRDGTVVTLLCKDQKTELNLKWYTGYSVFGQGGCWSDGGCTLGDGFDVINWKPVLI